MNAPAQTEAGLRLYIERLPDGGYDVVCNELVITPVCPSHPPLHWIQDAVGIPGAIEALTQPLMDDIEHADDVAGVRVGYQAHDMLAVAYAGEVRWVPDFRLQAALARLMGEVEREAQ